MYASPAQKLIIPAVCNAIFYNCKLFCWIPPFRIIDTPPDVPSQCLVHGVLAVQYESTI